MALQKQKIPLNIVDGIDTKTNEKNVLATRWLKAENVVFTESMAAKKDQGFTALTASVDGGSDLTSGNAISTFNDELIQYSSNKLFSYSPAKSKWYDKGYVSNTIATKQTIDVTKTTAAAMDYTTISGVTCYAYYPDEVPASAKIYIRLVDDESGAVLKEHTITDSGALLVCVGQINNNFVIFYTDSTNIFYRYIAFSNLQSISSATSLGTCGGDYGDCALIGSRLYVAWADTANTAYKLLYLDASFVASSTVSGSIFLVGPVSVTAEGSNVRLTYENQTALFDANLATVHAATAFNATMIPRNATAIQDPTNSAQSIIWYHDNLDASQIGVKSARVTSGGVVTDLGFIMYAANLVSKLGNVNGELYAAVIKKINDDSTNSVGSRSYFLISSAGQIVAKVADEVGLRHPTVTLKRCVVSGSELSFFAPEYYEYFDLSGPDTSTATSVNKYMFNFSADVNYFDSILGSQLHVAGGVLSSYDGNVVTEHGFLEVPITPDTPTIDDISPAVGIGSGVLADYPQTVGYKIVFAWTDSRGQIHRSAPSTAVTVSIPDNTSKATLSIRPLTLTNKDKVEVEVYRTEGNGSIYYKVSSLSDVNSTTNPRLNNDPSSTVLTFVDVAPDEAITDKEVLYTTGSVLENIAPLNSRFAVSNKSRLFLLDGSGYQIQYSKLKSANVGVEFNDALIMPLDSIGGPGTALGVLDENLVIFKENSILYMAGEGPNNLGAQDDYRQPVSIPSDVGCSEPASVVSTALGIIFKSKKGLYILRRNLSVEYIGAPVEAYNSTAITSTVLLSDVNQVRFTTAGGTCLIYDYYHNRWSTRSNVAAQDAVIWDDEFTFLKSNGVVMKQSGWSDNGTYVSMVLESAWISFAGVQGFGRFYKMLVAGDYQNAHQIKVSFAYDFNDTYVDSVTVDATTYFASGDPYQFEVNPTIQKCQAFKFKIETLTDGVMGADVTLTNFMLVVGLKGSEGKLKTGYSFAAT
jgi:hypothetical protein